MQIKSIIERDLPEFLELLEKSVNIDSPSNEKELCDHMSDWYSKRFTEITGGTVERIPSSTHGDRLLCKVGQGSRRVLLLGHYDTVWPTGESVRRPFSVQDGKAFGPGVYDMKAPLLQAMYAIKALLETGRFPQDLEVLLLINSDEEIGSPTSRELIESVAKTTAAVLVIEPPMEPTGSLKTSRKGSGRFYLKVKGRAAHAGVKPEAGVSAVVELAHQILQLDQLNDYEIGTTVNAGIIKGGIGVNVVAPEAEAAIDVRVKTQAEADRVTLAIRSLQAVHPEASLTIEGGMLRPPMERSEQIAQLYQLALEVARAELGEEIGETSTGGVSDGNFTAAIGIPTLDGLGIRGDHAHSPNEFIWIDEIPKRTTLLAGLIEKL